LCQIKVFINSWNWTCCRNFIKIGAIIVCKMSNLTPIIQRESYQKFLKVKIYKNLTPAINLRGVESLNNLTTRKTLNIL